MEFVDIVEKLDESLLLREVINFKQVDDIGVSYRNVKSDNVQVVVNGDVYSDLIKVCLKGSGDSVKLYVNYVAPLKFVSFDVGDVLSFVVS